MTRKRVQQHRPERDTASAQKLNDIKAENRQLKKQIKQLRKELGKEQNTSDLDDEDDLDEVEVPKKPSNSRIPSECPRCGATNVGTYKTTTGALLLGCRSCKKWRDRIEQT